MALTEDHQETTNGLPVPDELQDGPLLGSNPPHHRPPRRQPTRSVKEVTFGIDWVRLPRSSGAWLADVSDYDILVWTAMPDHDPAGVQEGEDAFGGEVIGVLTGGRRAGDRVEEADDAGLDVCFDRLSPAGSPGEACDEAGAEQQRDRDHLGDRGDPQGGVGSGQEEVVGEAAEREISPAARPPTAAVTTTTGGSRARRSRVRRCCGTADRDADQQVGDEPGRSLATPSPSISSGTCCHGVLPQG